MALAVVAAAAWVLRASPFFRFDGVLGWPVDYDEGVYTAASALLFRGSLPYRDFAFVHPPGLPLVLGLFTGWPVSPSGMLAAARVGGSLVGLANVALLGLLVRRHAGVMGGLLAALLYAAWPEAVLAERGVFLEPWLNLLVLGAAWAWLGERPRPRLAGALLGVALGVKAWGLLWLAAGLLSARSRKDALRFGAAAAVTAAVVVGPFALLAPGAFWESVVRLQVLRPPDGDLLFGVRLHEMFLARTPVPLALWLLFGGPVLVRWREPAARFLGAGFVLVCAAFFGAAVYWNQYNAHLALPLSALVGLGFGWWWEGLGQRWPRWGRAVVAVLVLASLEPSVRATAIRRRERAAEQPARQAVLRERGGARACAFEVKDLLLADRLPAVAPGVPPLVDSYGQMLRDAVRGPEAWESADAALRSPAAQALVRRQLEACDAVSVGWRGEWQLDAASKAWLSERFGPPVEGVVVRR